MIVDGIDYCFLSMLIPDEYYDDVYSNSKNNMQDAANIFEWNIYNGIYKNIKEKDNLKIINLLPIGSFPQYYKKVRINRTFFKTIGNEDNINIGFLNVKLIRRLSIRIKVFIEVKRWLKNGNRKKVLIVNTLNDFFIEPISVLKKLFDFTVCAIVADLPKYSSLGIKSKLSDLLQNLFVRDDQEIGFIDSFVFVAEPMADYLNVKVPYCVVEGIASFDDCGESNCILKKRDSIVYTGSLHKKFGVMQLIYAFNAANIPNLKLVLCGNGDSVEDIKMMSKKNSNIIYLGQLPRCEVLKIQRDSLFLVNPRNNLENYTRYSFPSKNIEYLMSGRPVLCYKLEGIPDEYDEYFSYVEGITVEDLSNSLITFCNKTEQELEMIGKAGREFVKMNKTPEKQAKKILDMLNELN